MNRKERRTLQAKSRKNGTGQAHATPSASSTELPRLEGPSLEAVQQRFRHMQKLKAHHSDQIRQLRLVEQQIDRAEQDLGQLSTTLLLSVGIDANADPAVRYVIDPDNGQVHRAVRQGPGAPAALPAGVPPASAPATSAAPSAASDTTPEAAAELDEPKAVDKRRKPAVKDSPVPTPVEAQDLPS